MNLDGPPTGARHVTTSEACEILGVSVHTIARWVRAGKLRPAAKLRGARGAYLFDRESIEQLRRDRGSR